VLYQGKKLRSSWPIQLSRPKGKKDESSTEGGNKDKNPTIAQADADEIPNASRHKSETKNIIHESTSFDKTETRERKDNATVNKSVNCEKSQKPEENTGESRNSQNQNSLNSENQPSALIKGKQDKENAADSSETVKGSAENSQNSTGKNIPEKVDEKLSKKLKAKAKKAANQNKVNPPKLTKATSFEKAVNKTTQGGKVSNNRDSNEKTDVTSQGEVRDTVRTMSRGRVDFYMNPVSVSPRNESRGSKRVSTSPLGGGKNKK